MTKKTIYIGSDHGGFDLKEALVKKLTEASFVVEDQGTANKDRCDYPDYIFPVAEKTAQNPESVGVVICTSGIGASICANKVEGIRCALCFTEEQAIMSRRHNNANVIAFGSKYVSEEEAFRILTAWIEQPFDGDRHVGRLNKIAEYEHLEKEGKA